jgi:TPR repeat protein
MRHILYQLFVVLISYTLLMAELRGANAADRPATQQAQSQQLATPDPLEDLFQAATQPDPFAEFVSLAQTKPIAPVALTPEQLFTRCSQSVVQVRTLDRNGQETSFGSGFIVDGNRVITNAHVANLSSHVRVVDANGKELPGGKVLFALGAWDLAVIQLDPVDKPALSVADSSTLKVGQRVYVIGSPEGLANTLSDGLISAIRSEKNAAAPTLQITAPISHGSSGGPVLSESGQVIGIASASLTDGQNLNFAVSANPIPFALWLVSERADGFGELRKIAGAGNVNGMLLLAACLPQGSDEALKWYQKAADAGSKSAMTTLGRFYRDGQGVPKDGAQALSWYLKAANAGDASAMSAAASIYEHGSEIDANYTEAMKWYLRAVDAGDAAAMRSVGDMYLLGEGVKQGYSKAIDWYGKAADAGDTLAMCTVGHSYEEEQDFTHAMVWYRKAVEGGYKSAMCSVGHLYEHGVWGVEPDYAQAMSWYQQAADAGLGVAMDSIGNLYHDGKGVPKDDTVALAWFLKGAAQGDAHAMCDAGNFYSNGLGTTKDYEQAGGWYQKAADLGDASAMESLGIEYENGEGVIQDFSQAMKWYRKAAQAGDVVAMYRVGMLYEDGMGVPPDDVEARKWLRRSAGGGWTIAKIWLTEHGEK